MAKLTLDQEDLDALADAIAKRVQAAPAAEKPAGKPAKPAAKPAAKEAPAALDRNAVLELARQVRAEKGADKAKAIIGEFGESFKDVTDDDLPKLEGKLKAALAGDGEDL